MPLFHWICPKCGRVTRVLLPTRPEQSPLCELCKIPLQTVAGGSTSVMESLDNGAMSKKVVRYRDAEEMGKKHSRLPKPKDPDMV